jgi:hypothetical protein
MMGFPNYNLLSVHWFVGRWIWDMCPLFLGPAPLTFTSCRHERDVPSIVILNQLHTTPSFYLLIISKLTVFIFFILSSIRPSFYLILILRGDTVNIFHLIIHPHPSIFYNFFCYSSQGVMLCLLFYYPSGLLFILCV